MPFLVDAYLAWRSSPWSAQPTKPESLSEDITPQPERPGTPEWDEDDDSELPSDASSGQGDFVMQGVDTFRKLTVLLHHAKDTILILSSL